MAEPEQQSMIDRLRGYVPDPVMRAVDPLSPLREMIQRYTTGAPARPSAPAERPAPTEGGTPVTLPAAQPQQGPRRPSTPAVVTPTAAAATALPAQPQAGPSEPSLLESLRQAVAQDVGPLTGNEQLAAFGRGVLSNRGSFLANLSAGLAAQGQAETARRAELRQSIQEQARLAEMERKAQLEKAQFAEASSPESLTGRLRESQIRENLGRARYYEEGGRGGAGVGSARNRITPQLYSQMYNQAEQEARRQYPDPMPGMVERPGEAETRRTNRETFRDRRLQELLEGASRIQEGNLPAPRQAAPQAAAPTGPTIDASGRPIR